MRSVIGPEGGRASSERDVTVHHDIGGAFCGEVCHCDSEHVRTAAEAVHEEEDVGVSSGRGRQGPKLVSADRNARAVGQGNREDGPANCLAGDFPRLTLEATVYPPFRAGFHPYPPVIALQYFQGTGDTKVTGGIRVACMHHLRSSKRRHVDVDGVIKGRSAVVAGDGGVAYK